MSRFCSLQLAQFGRGKFQNIVRPRAAMAASAAAAKTASQRRSGEKEAILTTGDG
tara:strand:- start:316 stop:480 length:165 start_codon:yes stop_codon:yes gene_type:complete